MGNLFAFLFVVVFVLARLAAKNAGKGTQSAAQRRAEMQASVRRLREFSERTAEQRERTNEMYEKMTAEHRQAVERLRAMAARKRDAAEDAEHSEQWRAAKQKQDDAEQLHAIHIDSCESKLESLRVLYDAGILDREEYAQRVARVKAKHGR